MQKLPSETLCDLLLHVVEFEWGPLSQRSF